MSSFKADLLGDDIPAPSEPAVAVPGGHKTNEDLLAEIFGGSTATSATSPTPVSQPQKTTADDILSLFDSPAPSAPLQATPAATSSLFDLAPSATPAAPPPAPAPAPKLQSYTVYNKNDLVISLTPQRSTTQPGVVDILARFQVKGNTACTGLNFQVAVPKVSNSGAGGDLEELCPACFKTRIANGCLFLFPPDATVANAAHVSSGCQSRSD
jgi:AP-1 complex subunit gamma-1